ncbi:Kinesin-like protein [Melia azedarach]|uniref:Kinesin-like protein n=1 Tax=Melia azedarach TaxID=155640 RepID=A0ACC1X5B7_MELAZ|nr:Kinesin-like protein [Melia azedarach]
MKWCKYMISNQQRSCRVDLLGRACLIEAHLVLGELEDLKDLLSRTRGEFKDLESQLLSDLKELGSQVQEMSTAMLDITGW